MTTDGRVDQLETYPLGSVGKWSSGHAAEDQDGNSVVVVAALLQ
jgi:hypothetical protein